MTTHTSVDVATLSSPSVAIGDIVYGEATRGAYNPYMQDPCSLCGRSGDTNVRAAEDNTRAIAQLAALIDRIADAQTRLAERLEVLMDEVRTIPGGRDYVEAMRRQYDAGGVGGGGGNDERTPTAAADDTASAP